MADLNMYQAGAVRFENGEMKWGQPFCAHCNGRGWVFEKYVENGHDILDIGCCSCAPVYTPEDKDRLEERLFIVAHVYDLGGEEEGDEPQDESQDVDISVN